MLSRFAALASVSLTRKVSILQTAVNPQSENIDLPPVSFVEWVGADGWPMQGLYYPPCGERGAGPPPTLMYVHGGPIGVQTDKYNAAGAGGPCSVALLQQAGYAVFSPNYRGSVGWGLAFAEADWEDCGGKDWQDMQVILPPASGASNEGPRSRVVVFLPPFLGPGFRLAARWNHLGETLKTRKKREKTEKKWARYSLTSVKEGN